MAIFFCIYNGMQVSVETGFGQCILTLCSPITQISSHLHWRRANAWNISHCILYNVQHFINFGVIVYCLFTTWFQFFVEYVTEIYETLISTSREDLTAVKDELSRQIPEPLHSMLPHKESKDEAIHKYTSRQQKETSICQSEVLHYSFG